MAAEYVCDRCGGVNPIGTVSCVNCHAFLALDQVESDERREGEQPTGQKSREPRGVSEQNVETRAAPRIRVPATAPETDRNPASPTRHNVPTDSTKGLFRIIAEQREVAVRATGEPAVLSLRIMNTSAIVDSYDVETASAPRWLQVESIQIRLLPGGEEALAIRMRVASPSPVPAQRVQVMLGIRSMRQATAHAVVPVVGQQHRHQSLSP